MIKEGTIYYASFPTFGANFIDIFKISDEWVHFYKSPLLNDLIHRKEIDDFSLVKKSQCKLSSLSYRYENPSYDSYFIGVIEIPIEIIFFVKRNKSLTSNEPLLLDFPFITTGDHYNATFFINMPSKSEYRNWMIKKVID